MFSGISAERFFSHSRRLRHGHTVVQVETFLLHFRQEIPDSRIVRQVFNRVAKAVLRLPGSKG